MDAILKFLSSNKDALLIVIMCITAMISLFTLLFGSGFLPASFRSIASYLNQRADRRNGAINTFPFEVIKPNSDVLEAAFPEAFPGEKDDPLADRNIRYLARVADHDIQAKLKKKLEDFRWVLILGQSGLGKTREAAELAQKYNRLGWTVLRLKPSELLDEPTGSNEDKIGTDRKLLFFLDNLNRLMNRRGDLSKEAPKQFRDLPPQERLRLTLEYYEQEFGSVNIRVIAIARNEAVPYLPPNEEKVSELDKLGLDKYPKLWRKFTKYTLPKPSNDAIIQLLKETVEQAEITANPNEYAQFAKRNDRTFENILLNIRTARGDERALSLDTFQESLRESWKEIYRKVKEKYPIADKIYDAVELLRAVDVELQDFTVIATTQMLAGGNRLQRLQRQRQIHRALHYLKRYGNSILEPRDGQIEAKEEPIGAAENLSRLSRLLLKLSDQHPQQMFDSLYGFALAAFDLKRYWESLASLNKLLKLQSHLRKKNDYEVLVIRGIVQGRLENYPEAIASFDRAIKLQRNHHNVWFMRGGALYNWRHYQEALASFDKAIEFKKNDHAAWVMRGAALDNLERYEDALASFDQAIEIEPDEYEAWYYRGNTLRNLERHEDALASFDQAIEINSKDPEVWNYQGVILGTLERYEDAIASHAQAITLKLDFCEAWYNLGNALSEVDRYEEAIISYNHVVSIQVDKHEAWYNRGIVLSVLERYKEAIASFDQAIAIKPDDHEAWYNRGYVLMKMGDYEKAVQSYDKSLERLPDNAGAFYSKACCFAPWGKVEEAVANLRRAIELNPDKCREMAKTDADFDSIRDDVSFQALLAAGL